MSARLLALLAALALSACMAHGGAGDPHGSARSPVSFQLPELGASAPHDLRSDRGQVVLLDIWSTWCTVCQHALPAYQALLQELGPKGFCIYAISEDTDVSKVAPFLAQRGLAIPVLLDSNSQVADEVLHVRMMPTVYVLDRSGVIRAVEEGHSPSGVARVTALVKQLLAEPVTIQGAHG